MRKLETLDSSTFWLIKNLGDKTSLQAVTDVCFLLADYMVEKGQ